MKKGINNLNSKWPYRQSNNSFKEKGVTSLKDTSSLIVYDVKFKSKSSYIQIRYLNNPKKQIKATLHTIN